MMRYDRKSLTWTQKLNLAHIAEKNIKKKLKQTEANAQLVQYRFKIRLDSSHNSRLVWAQ